MSITITLEDYEKVRGHLTDGLRSLRNGHTLETLASPDIEQAIRHFHEIADHLDLDPLK